MGEQARPSTPSGRSRRSRTDRKIAEAVLELVRSGGPAAVTIQAVSELSGVARTTLYRRYADRFELLEAIVHSFGPVPPVVTSDVDRSGLVELLRWVQASFEERVGFAMVGTLLASEEAVAHLWRDNSITPTLGTLRDYLEAGVRQGVLRPEVDYALVLEMVLGGMVLCDALRGDVPDDWADDVVATLWPVIGVHRPGASDPKS